jgi:hypothetical protein
MVQLVATRKEAAACVQRQRASQTFKGQQKPTTLGWGAGCQSTVEASVVAAAQQRALHCFNVVGGLCAVRLLSVALVFAKQPSCRCLNSFMSLAPLCLSFA